jgi:5'-3' exonuclease
MILIDYSGIAIAPIIMGHAKFNDENLLRHMILNTIRMYRQKFKKYGDVVIVADAGGNWRKEIYPEYKFKRKKDRDESGINWDETFRILNMILEEIKENFPYKVIHQWGCEADDSISAIVRWSRINKRDEYIMIVSADKDFRQLQSHNNVFQFSPMTKKFIKEFDPDRYLYEHILSGDASDGVPNVMSDDKVFAEGRKQNTLSAKRKAALIQDPKSLGDEVYRNFLRNKKMIDISENIYLPKNIEEEIIKTYVSQNKVENKTKVLPYFISNQCRNLIEVIEEFIN